MQARCRHVRGTWCTEQRSWLHSRSDSVPFSSLSVNSEVRERRRALAGRNEFVVGLNWARLRGLLFTTILPLFQVPTVSSRIRNIQIAKRVRICWSDPKVPGLNLNFSFWRKNELTRDPTRFFHKSIWPNSNNLWLDLLKKYTKTYLDYVLDASCIKHKAC